MKWLLSIVDNKPIPVLQGSYCWGKKCVDMIPGPKLIQSKQYTPVVVAPESKFSVNFNNQPIKDSINVSLSKGENTLNSFFVENDTSISFPNEPGIYIYSIGGRWEKGSSSYIFAVEVR